MMNNVLRGLTDTRCFYLDDIVIYSNSFVDHDRKLRDVFRRMRKYILKVQPDKYQFLRKEVTFLEQNISEHGVEPDARKTDSIKNFPTHKTAKLKGVLRLAGYCIVRSPV
jgi:hypothetical protein